MFIENYALSKLKNPEGTKIYHISTVSVKKYGYQSHNLFLLICHENLHDGSQKALMT